MGKDLTGAIKNTIMSSLLFASFVGFTQPTFAAQENNISVRVNGVAVVMAEGKAYVDAAKNTTYVPLRFVSEALNAKVGWDAATKQADVKVDNPEANVQVTVGKPTITVNGVAKNLNAPAVLKSTTGFTYPRTMVPLRAISEGLGAKVVYNAADKRVDIITTWETGNAGTTTPSTLGTNGNSGNAGDTTTKPTKTTNPTNPDETTEPTTPPVSDQYDWKPYPGSSQVEIAPKVFAGIKYNKSTGKLQVTLPAVKDAVLLAGVIEGPNPKKGKVTKLQAGKTYNFTASDFSLNIYYTDKEGTGMIDSYSILTEAVAKIRVPLPVDGDLTVLDQYQNMVPLSTVYKALGITP
ncbi:hypothetical protein D1872_132930 [compost metagenome]